MAAKAKRVTPRNERRRQGALAQLFVLVVLPITLLLLIVSFGSVSIHQSAMRSLVGERDQRAAQTAANALSEDFDHQATLAEEVVQELGAGTDAAEILADRRLSLEEFDAGLAVFTRDGDLLASNENLAFWQQLAPLLETLGAPPDSFTLSETIRGLPNGEHILLGAAAISESNQVLLSAFSIEGSAGRHLSDLSVGDQLSLVLYSSELDKLYSAGAEIGVPVDKLSQELAANPEVGALDYEVAGEQIVAAYGVVEPFGWILVIEEPWQALLNPLLTYTELVPLLLVPLVLLAIGIAWFAIRQLVSPLRELEARSAAMTRGDFEAVKSDVGGIAEINRLQQTLIFLAEKVQSAQQSLHSYVGAITKGQEEERMRLAHELHDDTIQSLIALNQKVQMAQMPAKEEPSGEALAEIGQMVEHSIEGVRRLTRDLRPLYLEDLGLAAALEMLAQETNRESKTEVEYSQTGRAQRLDPETELALYRITQEALNNSIQHAGASNVSLQLAFALNKVSVIVSDDGNGFEVPESLAEFAHHGHFGLLGMYERAELIDAQFEVRSRAGGGTHIELQIGLPPAENDKQTVKKGTKDETFRNG